MRLAPPTALPEKAQKSVSKRTGRCRALGKAELEHQPAPIADPLELDRYDAILFGTPTRFGSMAAQMRNSWIRQDRYGPEMRMPTALDLEMCRFQGEHVTRIAHRMAAGVATGRTCRDQRPTPSRFDRRRCACGPQPEVVVDRIKRCFHALAVGRADYFLIDGGREAWARHAISTSCSHHLGTRTRYRKATTPCAVA